MPPFATTSAGGGRLLTRHLRRLCSSLEALAGRVRAAVAEALGQGVAGAVREAVEAALAGPPEPSNRPSSTSPAPRPPGGSPAWWYDPDRPDWDADDPYDEPPDEDDAFNAVGPPPAPRWRSALAAGLQAAAFYLKRWPARLPWPWAVGLGLVAGAAAYLGGPPRGAGRRPGRLGLGAGRARPGLTGRSPVRNGLAQRFLARNRRRAVPEGVGRCVSRWRERGQTARTEDGGKGDRYEPTSLEGESHDHHDDGQRQGPQDAGRATRPT
jgi:hypothetical protein